MIAGSGLALAVALGALVAWLIGWIQFGDVLDKASVETGVVKVLNEHYGEADVTRADCPSGESVKPGNTFDCSVEISGKERTVGIKVINEKPEFEVGKPE